MTTPDLPEPAKGTPEFLTFHAMVEHISQLKWEANEVVASMREDEKAIADLEKQVAALKAKNGKREAARFEIHKAIRKETEEMEALKRRLALEAEERRIAALMAQQRLTLDELTKDAEWRDFALPHQLEGMHFLASARRAIVADGMGTGKTLQSIMCLDAWKAQITGGKRVLIIPPGEVVQNFVNEIKKWSPKRGVVNMAGKGTEATAKAIDFFATRVSSSVHILNYEILARSYGSRDQKVLKAAIAARYDTVICDEAHRLKETDRPTFKAIRSLILAHNLCPICDAPVEPAHGDGTNWAADRLHRMGNCVEHGLVEDCHRSVGNVLMMTGTPILNRPDEIFALLHLVAPAAFPNLHTFTYDFCTKGWDNKWKWQAGGESRLVNKIKGMYIRRTREDAGIILPPQDKQIHELTLDPETYPLQVKILEMLRKHAQIEIEEGRAATMMSMLALITRQRQATVWPGGIYIKHPVTGMREHVGAHYLESIKLDKAVELAKEFHENGERSFIVSQFAEPIDEMVTRLNAEGIRAVAFYGDTPRSVRDAVKRNFDRAILRDSGEEVKWDVVVAHYGLAGEGLNLTAATQTIVLDEQWNPGKNQQAYDRTVRMGQTEETGLHILRVKNSIDGWMADLIEEKRKIVDGFEVEITFQQLADMFKTPPKSEGEAA